MNPYVTTNIKDAAMLSFVLGLEPETEGARVRGRERVRFIFPDADKAAVVLGRFGRDRQAYWGDIEGNIADYLNVEEHIKDLALRGSHGS